MIPEFFATLDSLEIISLFVSFLVLGIAIYRWLIIRWQSQVDLKEYVFLNAVPEKMIVAPFTVNLDVPFGQNVVLRVTNGSEAPLVIIDKILEKGNHEVLVDLESLDSGRYELVLNSEGQEDIKILNWLNKN